MIIDKVEPTTIIEPADLKEAVAIYENEDLFEDYLEKYKDLIRYALKYNDSLSETIDNFNMQDITSKFEEDNIKFTGRTAIEKPAGDGNLLNHLAIRTVACYKALTELYREITNRNYGEDFLGKEEATDMHNTKNLQLVGLKTLDKPEDQIVEQLILENRKFLTGKAQSMYYSKNIQNDPATLTN